MIHKTYFSKDNTLYKSNPNANLGQDPILQLGYGGIYGDYSRVIFDFDINNIKEKINNREIVDNNLSHYLVMYNTYSFDTSSLQSRTNAIDEIPASFSLDLCLLNEDWDEGNGYSLKNSRSTNNNTRYSEQGSNFLNAKTNQPWTTPFNNIVKEIIFDVGDESIRVDITSIIKDLIEDDTDFHGFILKFKNNEGQITTQPFNINFYGKNTHTFFRPFIETVWDENIVDDRKNITLDSDNKIFLYPTYKGNSINLDSLPTKVDIIDSNDNIVQTITDIKHEYVGMYSVTLDSTLLSINSQYYDSWQGLKYENRNLSPIENEFFIYDDKSFTNNSNTNNAFYAHNIKVSFNGILQNEFINSYDKRKFSIKIEDYDGILNNRIVMDLYIKQGNNKIYIFENEPFIKTECNNIKYMDFSWFTPQEYFIDIYFYDKNVRFYLKTIKFNILDSSSKEKNKSY